jgi:hypothetical protein
MGGSQAMSSIDWTFDEPAQDWSFDESPIPMNKAFGSMPEGVKLHLKRQAVGAQQIGSDIGRFISGEIGQEYSPYRQELERRRLQLEKETKEAPLGTKYGDIAAGALEFGAIPMPMKGGSLARMAWNAVTGAGFGALEPQESGYKRGIAAGEGAMLGAFAPEIMSRIPSVGAGIRGIVSPNYAGARYAAQEFPGMNLPEEVGGRWSNVPKEGEMGPVTEPFFHSGAKPTVGYVTSSPELRQLETLQRLKPGSKLQFAARDLENQLAVQRGVQERSITQAEENAAKAQLNRVTDPMREKAYENIRTLGMQDEAAQPLREEIERIKTAEGTRANPNARKIALETEKYGLGVGHPEFPEGYPGGPSPEDLYQARKNINDSLKKTGVNLSKQDIATQSARVEAMAMKEAIDQGMNFASAGSWQKYLDEYIKGIAPITEGKAFRSILDLARNVKKLPGEDIRPITPYMMRRGASDLTTQEMGKETIDLLTPQNRRFVNEAADALDAMENAQIGVRGTAGPATAEYGSLIANEIVNRAASNTPGGKFALDLVSMLGQSRGSRILNEALLDPNKMQGLLKMYHQGQAPTWFGEAASRAGAYVPEMYKRKFGAK